MPTTMTDREPTNSHVKALNPKTIHQLFICLLPLSTNDHAPRLPFSLDTSQNSSHQLFASFQSQQMAMIADFLVKLCLTKLAAFVEGEICKVLGVEEEIKRFQRRLQRLSPFLQDAEQKRHQDAGVNAWLTDLKEIVYDAEDIIDLCMLPGGDKLLSIQPSSSSSSSAVSSPFTLLASCFACTKSRHEIAVSFERLNDRLKEIKDDHKIIASLGSLASRQCPQEHQIRSRPTTSLGVKADIVGAEIEDAAQTLISMILKHDHKQNGVFGIVGMGGMGKTTLAQKIFNDERIKNDFPICIWIYVSKNYTEIELLKQMLENAKGSDDGAQSMQELESKLVGALVNRFFIVLDDVWSVNVWTDVLRNPILNAKFNGIILVTSRHEKVMKYMGAGHIHHVQRMNEDVGLELFRKVVFKDEENENPELDEMAAKIVRKCDGLPLAIKAIAGMLISKKRTRREWERVLESDLWRMRDNEDELPRALYLSYEDLPSVLKQCFLCCASYINVSSSRDLVRLWIAEGLIDVPNGGLMEEVAEDYYNELVTRNLLQLNPTIVNETRYSMHDLLRALGTNLMGDEALVISDGRVADTNPNPLTKIRRLWMSSKGDTLRLPGAVLEQKSLRVLQLSDSSEIKTIEDEAAALPALKNLRVLDVCDTQIERLPDFIFMNLLLLRYLDLDRTKIRKLPESIGRLANLQTLNIYGCKSLRSLPKAVTSLGMLRCLRVDKTPLTHLPRGMGRLTNLNHIEGFVVGHGDSPSNVDDGCDLAELQSLSKLRFLSVDKLERATMAGASVLTNKPLLRHLFLLWTNGDDGEKEAAEKTCSGLLPPSSLEDLRLYNFPGRRFPNWMMLTSAGASFPHLEFLMLHDFPYCAELPPLGQLPRLKFLEIKGASAVRKVGPEFLDADSPQAVAFPRLEVLQFMNMPNWEEWTLNAASEEVGENQERSPKLFPRLEQCTFTDCPKLRGLPESIYSAARLKKIFISTNDQLSEVEFKRRETMEMDDCPDLILLRDSTELPHWLLDRINRERDEKNSEQPSRTVIIVKADRIIIQQNRQVDAV